MREDCMLLVDKLNKGKLPEKPESGEPVANPGLSSLVVKPTNVAARIPNIERIKRTVHERLITSLGMNSDTYSPDIVQRRIVELVDEYCEESKLKLTKHDREELAELILHDALRLGHNDHPQCALELHPRHGAGGDGGGHRRAAAPAA